jgi:hypothetical protein
VGRGKCCRCMETELGGARLCIGWGLAESGGFSLLVGSGLGRPRPRVYIEFAGEGVGFGGRSRRRVGVGDCGERKERRRRRRRVGVVWAWPVSTAGRGMHESQEKGAHSHSVFRLSVSFFCFLL